ncbi:flagellar biosynthesis protein FlhF [Paenibacillus sp. alder61]|uniref:flagellar biosynthesis protein FlhF n=1 Tax=Paenibacillus sp. alder61 TaxID=2862948 RepID=UPI001CD3C942|nr:flagellar biosynthesis protein FlhF [Paenibacillus sp. alder61]MCA1294207.1 flagellar biosynthesis protein FlhF [Paenibacillus sp. alder61]
MRVKRYIVDTMPDAMAKIRTELGANAVILSTKDLKVGGFLGMFGKKKIEVIAASEGEEDVPAAAKPQPRPVRPPAAPVARQAVPEAYRKSSQALNSAAASSTDETAPPAATPPRREVAERQPAGAPLAEPPSSPPPNPSPLSADIREAEEQTAASRWDEAIRQARREIDDPPSSPPLTGAQPMHSKEERLLEELREMKSWIGQLARQQHENRELPEPLPELKQKLADQEISPELIDKWIDAAYQEWIDSGKTAAPDSLALKVREAAADFLADRVGEGIRDETKIVYIAGPTGVGKTTTIAKLAADQIFRAQKKVGFITADTYRISAIEQLRTYSSILNVPLEVVQSPGDVQRAMQRLSYCDLILMDTAGRNYLNEIHVAELHSLLSPHEKSETYLVLSLTSKTQDMKKITEHFSRYGLDKVIFTKLDETESVGPMYNLLEEYPLRVSYIANGQNVPDDLLSANQDLLLNLILGDRPS